MEADIYEYFYCDLGRVAAACANQSGELFDISDLIDSVRAPIEQAQIRFIRNFNLEVIGYYTWARLTPSVSKNYISNPSYALHVSEWNEGDEIWIIDLRSQKGFLKIIYADICSAFGAAHTQVNWRSRNNYNHVRLDIKPAGSAQ